MSQNLIWQVWIKKADAERAISHEMINSGGKYNNSLQGHLPEQSGQKMRPQGRLQKIHSAA